MFRGTLRADACTGLSTALRFLTTCKSSFPDLFFCLSLPRPSSLMRQTSYLHVVSSTTNIQAALTSASFLLEDPLSEHTSEGLAKESTALRTLTFAVGSDYLGALSRILGETSTYPLVMELNVSGSTKTLTLTRLIVISRQRSADAHRFVTASVAVPVSNALINVPPQNYASLLNDTLHCGVCTDSSSFQEAALETLLEGFMDLKLCPESFQLTRAFPLFTTVVSSTSGFVHQLIHAITRRAGGEDEQRVFLNMSLSQLNDSRLKSLKDKLSTSLARQFNSFVCPLSEEVLVDSGSGSRDPSRSMLAGVTPTATTLWYTTDDAAVSRCDSAKCSVTLLPEAISPLTEFLLTGEPLALPLKENFLAYVNALLQTRYTNDNSALRFNTVCLSKYLQSEVIYAALSVQLSGERVLRDFLCTASETTNIMLDFCLTSAGITEITNMLFELYGTNSADPAAQTIDSKVFLSKPNSVIMRILKRLGPKTHAIISVHDVPATIMLKFKSPFDPSFYVGIDRLRTCPTMVGARRQRDLFTANAPQPLGNTISLRTHLPENLATPHGDRAVYVATPGAAFNIEPNTLNPASVETHITNHAVLPPSTAAGASSTAYGDPKDSPSSAVALDYELLQTPSSPPCNGLSAEKASTPGNYSRAKDAPDVYTPNTADIMRHALTPQSVSLVQPLRQPSPAQKTQKNILSMLLSDTESSVDMNVADVLMLL